MKILRALTRVVYIWRYPGYLGFLQQKYVTPYLVQKNGIELEDNVSFIGLPIVSKKLRTTIKIYSNSIICSRSKETALGVNHPVILRTLREGAKLIIGKGVRMSGATICAAQSVIIGDNTCLGANVTVVDTDFHSLDYAIRSSESDQDFATVAAVDIGPNVFVGMGSYVLKGVSIGEGAVIGAGSVIAKHPGVCHASRKSHKGFGIDPRP